MGTPLGAGAMKGGLSVNKHIYIYICLYIYTYNISVNVYKYGCFTKIGVPQYRPRDTVIPIIGIPKEVPLNLGSPHIASCYLIPFV